MNEKHDRFYKISFPPRSVWEQFTKAGLPYLEKENPRLDSYITENRMRALYESGIKDPYRLKDLKYDDACQILGETISKSTYNSLLRIMVARLNTMLTRFNSGQPKLE
jgi:hypothetical protein